MLVDTIRLDSTGEVSRHSHTYNTNQLASLVDNSQSIVVLNEPHLRQLAHDFIIDNQHVNPEQINSQVELVLTGHPFNFDTDVLLWMPHPWDDIDLFITIITKCDKSQIQSLLDFLDEDN